MAKQNSVNLDITNNADGFSIAGGSTSRTLGVSGADITLVGSGTATLTFPTTSTTIAGLGIAQTFTALQLFNLGISASNLSVVGSATFSGNILAPNIVNSINGSTGAITDVARINEGNTFSVLQVMNAGITSANLFVAGGSTFTGIASFRSGITAAGATFTGTIRANGLSTPSTVSGSNLTIESINETEVVPGILYTGGELNATAKNKIAFTVGSGNNTVPYPVLSFTNSNLNSAADITFTTLGGDIEMSAAGGIVFNPVTFINMADGVLYVDDTNNRVGVNKTSPSYPLDVSGLANFASGISASGITSSEKITSDSGFAITSGAINSRTGTTYAFVASDNGKVITWNATSGATLTVPTGLPVGFNATVISIGTGLIGISGASGVTLNSFESKLRIAGQHAAASIISYSSNIFNVAGGLTA